MIARSLLGRTLLVTVLTVIITHLATLLLFQKFYIAPLIQHTIEDRANHIFSLIAALDYLPPASESSFIRDFDDSAGGVIQTEGPNPQNVHTPNSTSRVFMLEQKLRQKHPGTRVWVSDLGRLPSVWIPLQTRHGEFWYITQSQRFDASFPEKWAILLTLVILLGASSVYWAVRRINQPLQDLAQAARQLASGQAKPLEIAPDIPSEIRQVSEAFRSLQESLQALESNRTVMLAGVSHDLRTPLSRLRLELEMLKLPNLNNIEPLVRDLEEIDRIIDQFLDFARDYPQYSLTSTNLVPLLHHCRERFAARGIVLDLGIFSLAEVQINERAMERVLTNLLENALRYGAPPFHVTLNSDGKMLTLSVRDHGVGILPSEVAHLLQPFTRRENSRHGPSGSGLGLAIVARIVALHQGHLTFHHPLAGGVEIRIDLPLRG